MARRIRAALLYALMALSIPAPAHAGGDAGATGFFDDGTPFFYHYLVEFWRENPPGTTTTDDPNDNAPGIIISKPAVFVHVPGLPKKEIALIERKLTIISDALLALPPLKDIRGSAIRVAINISQEPFDDGGNRIKANLSIICYPINLSDPQTTNVNGRYESPHRDALSLDIEMNGGPERFGFKPLGTYNGLPINEAKYEHHGYIADSSRPLTVERIDQYNGKPYLVMNPSFFDRSAPPSQIQLLTMSVTAQDAGFQNSSASPTTPTARELAALYMADWGEIVRRIDEIH